MAINLEDHIPTVRFNGVNTDKAVDLDSTLNVEGAVTLQSTLAVTGAIAATGGVTGGITVPVVSGSADVTVTAAQSGTVFFQTKTSATQTYTLPDAAAGLTYTFVCAHADSEILITPQTGEAIKVTAFAAVGADADTAIVAPAAGTGIKNTAATNAVGDSITIVSDGTGWYGVGIASGIWASQ